MAISVVDDETKHAIRPKLYFELVFIVLSFGFQIRT